MINSIQLITPPDTNKKILTTSEIKQALKIENDDDDSLLESLHDSILGLIETHTLRAILPQTLRVSFNLEDGIFLSPTRHYLWDRYRFYIPRPPLIDVTELKAVNIDGSEYVYPPTSYKVENEFSPGRIVLRNPSGPIGSDPDTLYQLTFRAGYETIPAGMKLAFRHLLTHYYYHRGDETGMIPGPTMALLNRFKVYQSFQTQKRNDPDGTRLSSPSFNY